MSGFTVHPAKVQRPPLRGETLARDRLLDWLHVQIHHRVVLVLADAGYGKTTLLADFSGRTRLRTLWYRLDEDDRDWMTFLHHLVAAGREHDPEFAPRTAAMLSDMDVAGPTRDTVIETFVRELPTIAEGGAVLVLDDFHLVDEAPDVKLIARELVAHGPERLTIVFSSRRAPGIPLAKLRAGSEVAELRTDDLRFDTDETARLFAETYGRPLEPDVLADLSARTEGWAASLQLVQAALRDRSPTEIRRIVRNLTGADRELYDYLAEEVVGDLPEELQLFLMRTSILQAVTPELAALVTDLPIEKIVTLTRQSERINLLSRRGRSSRDSLRYHPLVRDFLEARLRRSREGANVITNLHLEVARSAEQNDWRLACHHLAAAGDGPGVGRVIDAAIEQIVAQGETTSAESFLAALPDIEPRASFEVIRSRAEFRRGEPSQALQRAKAATRATPSSAIALMNLSSIALGLGDLPAVTESADRLADLVADADLKAMSAGMVKLIDLSLEGSVPDMLTALTELLQRQRARGQSHYEAVTLLNIAIMHQMTGDAASALSSADESLLLMQPITHGVEAVSARAVRAWALAHLGDLAAARDEIARATTDPIEMARIEALVEAAEIETWYGSGGRAADFLSEARGILGRHEWMEEAYLPVAARLAIRLVDLTAAQKYVSQLRIGDPSRITCLKARHLSVMALLSLIARESDAQQRISEALEHARAQGAGFWARSAEVMLSAIEGGDSIRGLVRRSSGIDSPYLSINAEQVASSLGILDEEETIVVRTEAQRRPERWRPCLRRIVDVGEPDAIAAARLLDLIGAQEDIARLRRFGRRSSKGPNAGIGRGLARRLAPRVFIEDQGRMAIRIGDGHVEGTAVRRKVLALLCFLLTRSRFSATRDEVLDALWPDSEPSVALNSLNQTVYFLRRVIEPGYREDASPGYIRHESDVVWLDRQLISSRSQLCLDFIRGLPPDPHPQDVERLAHMYHGHFALDFAYEEWAGGYRDTLHAAYLQVVERAVAMDIASGHFDRGILLARRALEIDPMAEQIEVSLLRLLRLSGAHAAAAEQYAHYATVLRESLGVEPPPLDAL